MKNNQDKQESFVFTLPVSYFSENKDMIDGKEQIVYYVRTKAKHLPDDIWFKTNPRKQNLTSKTAKKIKSSLLDPDNNKFHLLNRGILISADNVAVTTDESSKTVTITLTDKRYHGNIDGGHTYKLILDNKEEITDNKEVMLEIMTGVEGFYEDLAAARNTSVQVKDVSIAELVGKFDLVKNAVDDQVYADRIAYKENESKSDKDIPVQSILGLLSLFDIERYKDTHPTKVYSGITSVLNYYLKHIDDANNIFNKQKNIIVDIIDLYNQIEVELDRSQPVKSRPVKNTLFLKQNGMTAKTQTTKAKKDSNEVKYMIVPDGKETVFKGDKVTYKYGNAAIYPMLAALRVCLKENTETGLLEWEVDPKTVLNSCIDMFISEYIEAIKKVNYSPELIYKQTNLWSSLYDKAMIRKLMIQAESN